MKSIILRDFEVRGILNGSITQIVRMVKPQPAQFGSNGGKLIGVVKSLLPNLGDLFDAQYHIDNPKAIRSPFGRPGELLAGKEKWSDDFASFYPHDRVWYAADDDRKSDIEVRPCGRGIYSPESDVFVPFQWRSAACMPQWAVRIKLKNKAARIERVQDCSEADARRRGVVELPGQAGVSGAWWTADVNAGPKLHARNALAAYRALMADVWDANLWVWVLDIEVVKS